eukprot:7726724-Pyramimonas_sp.AAC.1
MRQATSPRVPASWMECRDPGLTLQRALVPHACARPCLLAAGHGRAPGFGSRLAERRPPLPGRSMQISQVSSSWATRPRITS